MPAFDESRKRRNPVKRYSIALAAVLVLLVFVLDASAQNNAVITGSGVRLRPSPTINAGVIRELARGTRVQILAHTDFTDSLDGFTGYWYYISYRGIYGYIFGKYIQPDVGVSIPSESEYFGGD
jgi:hypothetical protein